MGENNLVSAVQEQCGQPVAGAMGVSWEDITIQEAISQRRHHLQSMLKELDALENNLPGFILKLKRKDFQGIYSVL